MSSNATAQPSDSWRQMLAGKPVRNVAARVEQNADDSVAIYVKRPRRWYVRPPLSWIVPFAPERRVALDQLGTRVWTLCDGTRTVEGVVDAFAAEHRLSFHEARVAVTEYTRRLVQRGVLAIVAPE